MAYSQRWFDGLTTNGNKSHRERETKLTTKGNESHHERETGLTTRGVSKAISTGNELAPKQFVDLALLLFLGISGALERLVQFGAVIPDPDHHRQGQRVAELHPHAK